MKENYSKPFKIKHDVNAEFLNSKQVAKVCSVTTRTVTNYRNKGLLSFYKIGNSVFYRIEDVQDLLEHFFVHKRRAL
ncbi:MAG: helix-turn-helix domain-containing protein [Bacteroidota bacterium]